jgi:hypothetical protein
MGDIDPAVAEDLGVAMSPEAFEEHVTSGKAVADHLGAAAIVTELNTWNSQNDKGGFDHVAWGNTSIEQRIVNQRGVQAARDALAQAAPKHEGQ